MFKLLLNGKEIRRVKATSLLDAAKKLNIEEFEEDVVVISSRPIKYLIITDYSFQYVTCLADDLELLPC